MNDPHLNIFHAYRGPTFSEQAAIRQLEDNLTRALIVTLENVRNSPAHSVLLKVLGLPVEEASATFSCRLQVSHASPQWPAPHRRRLLVIHGGPRLVVGDGAVASENSRADAVITTADTLVAIESKLDNRVEQNQLDRHRSTLGIDDVQVLDITWSDLARTIQSIPANQRKDPIANFVLAAFEEYLRMNGFGGLTYDHFAFFAQAPQHRDPMVKEGIRRALAELGDKIVRSTGSHWHAHVMNIKPADANAGVVLESGARGLTPHLTLAIGSAGLDVHANVELQRAYKQFRREWRSYPDELVQIIRQLASMPVRGADDLPWRLSVRRRVHLGRPRDYHYWNAVDIAAGVLAEWSDEDIRRFVEDVTRQQDGEASPEILIIRSYSVAKVLATDHFDERVSSDALELEPFFRWIREPFRSFAP